MKKYIISTGIALLAVTSASAENQPQKIRPLQGAAPRQEGQMAAQMLPLVITTGDATTDAQIKVLQTEMETKIKAVRDEYQAKIKVVIGDKKILNKPLHEASTTHKMMKEYDSHDQVMGTSSLRGEARPPRRDGGELGSTSPRGEMGVPRGQQVRGASIPEVHEQSDSRTTSSQTENGFRSFFGRMFGR